MDSINLYGADFISIMIESKIKGSGMVDIHLYGTIGNSHVTLYDFIQIFANVVGTIVERRESKSFGFNERNQKPQIV